MTAEEAIEIAKAFGISEEKPFDDHTFEAVFRPKNSRSFVPDAEDEAWDVWVTYKPFKGLITPDAFVVEINCRTGAAILIKML